MPILTDQSLTDDISNEQKYDLDAQSPSKMAEAYLAAAIVERDNDNNKKNILSDVQMASPQDSLKQGNHSSSVVQYYQIKDSTDYSSQNTVTNNDPQLQIEAIWNELNENNGDDDKKEATKEQAIIQNKYIQKALADTTSILNSEIESLVRNGLEAFHGFDTTCRELNQMKDIADSRAKECKRLQDSEAQSQLTVSNLIRAVETSKSHTRDTQLAAQQEARLRSEITSLLTERDTLQGRATESEKRVHLLEEELSLLKSKLLRVTQEKIKIERDSRAAMSLARSLDNHHSLDSDFYKRKAKELSDRLQDEQTKNIELKRQLDRSFSQNALAGIQSNNRRRIS